MRVSSVILLAGLLGDQALAGAVVAVLGGVGDGVAHLGEAALVDQVNDQLHLVYTLEVSVLRRIAGLDQRLKASLHQLADAAAQHSLLAEQVGFRLSAEGRLQNARTAAADAAGISQSDVHRLAGSILMHAHQIRNTRTLQIGAANRVARTLRCDHDNVNVCGRDDLLEVDIEAVCESQHIARLEVRLDGLLVDVRLLLIRNQHHNDVARLGGFSRRHNSQTGSLCLLLMLGAGTQADDNVNAGIMQVFRMRVTLRTKTDNGDSLAIQ